MEQTLSPHVITATVNGKAIRREFDTHDAAAVSWTKLIEGVYAGEVTGLTFLLNGSYPVSIPDGGWIGPRPKGQEAE